MNTIKRKKQVKLLRSFRSIHRTLGAVLFVVFILVAITGLLLGWKKHSNGIILPKSHSGVSSNLKDWLSYDTLHTIACRTLHDSVSTNLSLELERIDARPKKGMVKFVFIDHHWGVQLDATTGNVLHIERRRSDIVEQIHDGSLLDYFFNTNDEQIKLLYTSITGLALLTFSLTGFWLWLGPKYLRKSRKGR